MASWTLALLAKPFAALLLLGFCLGVRWLVFKKMPEGRVKTALLKHRWGPKDKFMK